MKRVVHTKCGIRWGKKTLEKRIRRLQLREADNELSARASVVWWRCPGLNGGPAAYESAALPTELHRQKGWYTPRGRIQEWFGECLARFTHNGWSRKPVKTGWLLRSVWFVSFVWLGQTNQITGSTLARRDFPASLAGIRHQEEGCLTPTCWFCSIVPVDSAHDSSASCFL